MRVCNVIYACMHAVHACVYYIAYTHSSHTCTHASHAYTHDIAAHNPYMHVFMYNIHMHYMHTLHTHNVSHRITSCSRIILHTYMHNTHIKYITTHQIVLHYVALHYIHTYTYIARMKIRTQIIMQQRDYQKKGRERKYYLTQLANTE